MGGGLITKASVAGKEVPRVCGQILDKLNCSQVNSSIVDRSSVYPRDADRLVKAREGAVILLAKNIQIFRAHPFAMAYKQRSKNAPI